MECTSYIPVYHARDVNVGSSGFSWRLFNSNAKYGEENGYDISLPPYSMEQYLSYDKEVLRQIIQNHDATFRHQVQELHRLYRKQKELMDEMRVRKVFSQCLISQTTSESIPSLSHETSWLLGDHSHSKLSELTPENFQQPPKFIPLFRSNNVILDLELPADERNQFRERNLSKAPELICNTPEEVPNTRPVTDSETGSVKTRDLSSFNLNNGKRHCFIDLNIELESLPSSSKCPVEICHMEIMHNGSVVPKDSGFLNCDGSLDGINSSVAIDLNSMPDGYIPETEINLEHIPTIKKETTEDHPFVDNKLVKTEADIDLNTDVVLYEPSTPSPSNSTVQIKSGGDRDLEGPLSPKNEECSPRGKSEENIQLEMPSLLSEHGKKEPSTELDTIAAQTLVMILSCGAHDCLSWFAEIVSATGDDLENKITKLQNDAAYNNQNALKKIWSVVKKEKETGSSSIRSQKSHAIGKRRRKDTQTEVLSSLSKNVRKIEGFLESGSSRRKTVKKGCVKSRKNSKLSSDRVEKPNSSILKQPSTRSKHGVLRSWGKIKKREGGLRRKASKFIVISW